MQSDQQALMDGLLFGSDAGFSPELKQLTRSAGVTHLVAASGANLRFVSTLWLAIFQLFGARFIQSSIPLAIIAYWQLAEQSGSLWRASGMWFVTWLGSLWGRKISLWYSLVVTTVLTAVAWEQYLTPGFWLSVLAILGLMFSQALLSGEKKKALFPQRRFYSNRVALSLVEGSLIFVMVTLWLWPQYEVFEPIGIVATWVLGTWVDPLVWLGILEQMRHLVPGAEYVLEFTPLGILQEWLFLSFRGVLEWLAEMGQAVSPGWIVAASLLLSLPHFLQWKKQRDRKMRWRRLNV